MTHPQPITDPFEARDARKMYEALSIAANHLFHARERVQAEAEAHCLPPDTFRDWIERCAELEGEINAAAAPMRGVTDEESEAAE